MKPGKRLTFLILLGAALLLAVSLVVAYRLGLLVVGADRKMTAQLLIRSQLEDFFSTLKDAENGERGYLLTGEEAYLQPYRSGLSQVQKQLKDLQRLSGSGELPKFRVDRLAELTRERITALDQTIQTRREEGLESALTKMRSEAGKEHMEKIRAEIMQMRTDEEREFTEARWKAHWATALRTTVFIGAFLLNMGFLAWAYTRISREMDLREKAISEMTRQTELLATTLASIGDAVIITDAEGRITFLNREAERLTGWKTAEARAQAVPTVFSIIDEKKQPVENPVERVLRLGKAWGPASHSLMRPRSGSEIPVEANAAPIREPGGPIFGVVLTFRDSTEERQAREFLERSKEELESLVVKRTARLREMIGELQHVSYAITHDMRAPLRAMSGFASLLLESTGEGGSSGPTQEYSRRILVAASRLDKLIQDALHYTKAVLQEMPLEQVELSPLLRGLVETYPNLQPDKATIRIEGALPVVIGNEALLTQCFSNLLGNAVKFVQPGTRPEVRVHAEMAETTAKIWVEDNGIGIPQHAQARLFKMFQRLTNEYEGTGMGLAIVLKVVERMSGKVGVESEDGKGSRFWVELRTKI